MKIYWNGHSKNIIGNRLKELRTAQGISQKTLAARLQGRGQCNESDSENTKEN